MKLTNREMNVVLVSLDHMEEHLEIVMEAGDLVEKQYEVRMEACKTARTKIKENNE
jgi:hypothetical protein